MDIVVFARYWEPGKVKTRLCPPLSLEEAAMINCRFLDVLIARLRCIPELKPVIAYEPDWAREAFHLRYPGIHLEPQKGDGLGAKLCHVVFGRAGPCLITGSDCPTTPLESFRNAMAALNAGADVVLAPTEDGGAHILGAWPKCSEWFSGIPWSSGTERNALLKRSQEFGWCCESIAMWYDVDRPTEIPRVTEDLRASIADGEIGRNDFEDLLRLLDELCDRIGVAGLKLHASRLSNREVG